MGRMTQPLNDSALRLSFTQILALGINASPRLERYAQEEQDGTLFGGPKRTPAERAAWVREDQDRWAAIKREHPDQIAALEAFAAEHTSHLIAGRNTVAGVIFELPRFPVHMLDAQRARSRPTSEMLAAMKARAMGRSEFSGPSASA